MNPRYKQIVLCLFVFIFMLLSVWSEAQAASLTFVSDTISTSASGIGSDHTIRFTTINLVPVAGQIVIIPQAGFFSIPTALDFTDVDFSINGAEKSLGPAPGAAQSGAAVASGSAPKVTITLSANTFISPGSAVMVKIGKNAVHETNGDQQIANSISAGSFKIHIATYNSASVLIDEAIAMVAVISPVSVEASQPTAPPPPPPPLSAPSGGGGGGAISPLPPITEKVTKTGQVRPGNFNSDGKVDLVDLSILLYNWGKPQNTLTDINKDGKVDLVDFSILLYWWTG